MPTPASPELLLRTPSLEEKLAYFYCPYVREEVVDPETDTDAVRRWDKIAGSRRKARDRVAILLNQIENSSTANVRSMDATYRAKRELILLAEGTLRASPATAKQRAMPASLDQVESARVNNELLQECGALTVFSDHLQQSIHAFRGLNFQHLDLDRVDSLIGDLQRDMVLMYLLIVFNSHRRNAVFDRQLMIIGIGDPTYSLVTILDCLSQLNVLPGFPIKRLLLLFSEWFSAVLGSFDALEEVKKRRKAQSARDSEVAKDEANGLLLCKTFKPFVDTTMIDSQDPYYLQKLKFAKLREQIHNKYMHKPTFELQTGRSSDDALATEPLYVLDDEWSDRCETMYQLFLPCMREYTTFLSNLVTISCGSALNARDKKTFYSRRPSSGDQAGGYMGGGAEYGANMMGGLGAESSNDQQFWKWILREKSIVLDVSCQIILLVFKHFRASHMCKAEYFMQFFLENNLLATLTKYMNKDIATFLQVSPRQDADEVKTGFYALEREIDKCNIRVEDAVQDFSLQSTRTITTILRLLQKLTKRKPNIIKNVLCRGSSIVWLKVRFTIPALASSL